MKIGILSDSHNDQKSLKQGLEIFREQEVENLVHCGDLTSPAMVSQLKGFTVNYVYGNMDGDPMEIRKQIKLINPQNQIGVTFMGAFAGVRVAATHGHLADVLDELIKSGEYHYVFHGHSHRQRDEVIVDTRVINPGALGGVLHEPRSVCILDIGSGQASFINL